MNDRLLTIAEVAERLQVKEEFIRRLIRERRIRHTKVGHFIRFRPQDVDTFIEEGIREPAA